MKSLYTSILFSVTIFLSINLSAQVIWQGPSQVFNKMNLSDWTLPANQDSLTNGVILTRANNKGLFNIKAENNYTKNISPLDTEWAYGTTSDLSSLSFSDWETTHGGAMPQLGQDLVLHLISEDIYIDLSFSSWSGGMNGGFSYSRSTDTTIVPVSTVAIPTIGEWGALVIILLLLIIAIAKIRVALPLSSS